MKKTIKNLIFKIKKISDKIGSVILNVVFYAVFSCVLLYSLLFGLMGLDVGVSHYVVLTGSMSPTASPGDMVIVVKTDFDSLQEGDIISFKTDINSDGELETVTHYFAAYESIDGVKYIRTRRENSENYDRWFISESDLIGKCSLIIPKVGYYSRFLSSPLGLLTLVLDTTIIIIAIMLMKRVENSSGDLDPVLPLENVCSAE